LRARCSSTSLYTHHPRGVCVDPLGALVTGILICEHNLIIQQARLWATYPPHYLFAEFCVVRKESVRILASVPSRPENPKSTLNPKQINNTLGRCVCQCPEYPTSKGVGPVTQHTSAYVSMRQHTSAYVSIPVTRSKSLFCFQMCCAKRPTRCHHGARDNQSFRRSYAISPRSYRYMYIYMFSLKLRNLYIYVFAEAPQFLPKPVSLSLSLSLSLCI
jgi:hypothetical protein